jgi:hypothetical protein
MGGYGSTRWQRYKRKRTVDRAIKLSIIDLIRDIPLEVMASQEPWCASVGFRRGGAVTYSILYVLHWLDSGTPFLVIDYPTHQKRAVEEIDLTSTPCHLGGVRYWFCCPQCARRVECLYLPHGEPRFLCRKCHDLTYKSAQEAHQGESSGYLGIIGRNISELRRIEKLQKQLDGRHYASKAWIRITGKIDAILANIARRNGVMQQAREKHKQGLKALIKRVGY